MAPPRGAAGRGARGAPLAAVGTAAARSKESPCRRAAGLVRRQQAWRCCCPRSWDAGVRRARPRRPAHAVGCSRGPCLPTLPLLLQGYREDDGLVLESDTDEQLLVNIPFNQKVKLQSIIIKGPDDGTGPKRVKLYINKCGGQHGEWLSPVVLQRLHEMPQGVYGRRSSRRGLCSVDMPAGRSACRCYFHPTRTPTAGMVCAQFASQRLNMPGPLHRRVCHLAG